MKQRRNKALPGVLLLAAAAALLCLAVYMKSVAAYQRVVQETRFEEVDLNAIPDGTYTGEYDVQFIRAKVAVTVQDGAITEIQLLEHKNGRGEAAETVLEEIVSQQRIAVDAVSGATNSSIVLEKAVENALTKRKINY